MKHLINELFSSDNIGYFIPLPSANAFNPIVPDVPYHSVESL